MALLRLKAVVTSLSRLQQGDPENSNMRRPAALSQAQLPFLNFQWIRYWSWYLPPTDMAIWCTNIAIWEYNADFWLVKTLQDLSNLGYFLRYTGSSGEYLVCINTLQDNSHIRDASETQYAPSVHGKLPDLIPIGEKGRWPSLKTEKKILNL